MDDREALQGSTSANEDPVRIDKQMDETQKVQEWI